MTPRSQYKTKRTGFTLIELSIVLVIIGLIVGGVLVGQDLIKAAEMRSIASDWSRFDAARHTFRLKYNCLAGDCRNAASLGLGTNGNGNRIVDQTTVNTEAWQYWSQLASAGLIEGSYTGAAGPIGHYDAVIGTNVPPAERSGVGYSLYTHLQSETWNINLGVAESLKTHFIITGKDTATNFFRTWGGAFDVAETVTLDTKFDDGLANDGKIRTYYDHAPNLTDCTSTGAPNFSYDTSAAGPCNLIYLFIP